MTARMVVEDVGIFPNTHEAIIDEDVFEQVQEEDLGDTGTGEIIQRDPVVPPQPRG